MSLHLRGILGMFYLLAATVALAVHGTEAQFYYPMAMPVPATTNLPELSVEHRQRFLLYNPFNGQQLEPLRYMSFLRGGKAPGGAVSGNLVELPQLWQPCSCAEFTCRCCLGLVFGFGESFNQRVCTSIEYSRAELGLRLNIEVNQRSVANFGFSARNPPDYCVPLLLPLPLFSCLRLYDIQAYGEGNVQVCISVVFKVLVSQFFEYRFNCIRFGVNGVYFVPDSQQQDQDQGQGQAVEVELDKKMDAQAQEQGSQRFNLANDKLASGSRLDFHPI
ncbi:LOW QUALITY PROTEIN: uncharacterized protein LOC111068893 [Drosophila obscura]|uniref:LOW QUALITY PROTEIN: uncharacterized protein LOC111068893 n=1 Tax=Drosophila obscura TaxID=7282 RepID=UPI001BB1CC36|nr:LOW QUALITY PROTEIN: uncharacterized protein LOC111068893 [Drosophila obscura]